MDIGDLKKLIKNSTSVLVMDSGEPSFVVVSYEMYKDLVEERGEKVIPINHPVGGGFNVYGHHERETEILERLNKEILALKNQIEMEEKNADM